MVGMRMVRPNEKMPVMSQVGLSLEQLFHTVSCSSWGAAKKPEAHSLQAEAFIKEKGVPPYLEPCLFSAPVPGVCCFGSTARLPGPFSPSTARTFYTNCFHLNN